MIVVEGPDGAGKTFLIEELRARVDVPLGPRASTSGPHGGPVADLMDWVIRDAETFPTQPCNLRDRHPIFSEPIYGSIARNNPQDGFGPHPIELRWLRLMRSRLMSLSPALLIICAPPIEIVRHQVSAERDMVGVAENIERIYLAYLSLASEMQAEGWRQVFVYDWTSTDSQLELWARIGQHLRECK